MNNQVNGVIDYWSIIDFLTQPDYPSINVKDNETAQIIGHDINGSFNMEKMLDYDNKKHTKLPFISNTIEICLGKITRENCTKAIYTLLNEEDLREDKAFKNITVMAFQVTSLLRYVEGTFNISPILWMMYKIKTSVIKDMMDVDINNYYDDLKEIENWLKEKDEINENVLKECFSKVKSKFMKDLPNICDPSFQGMVIYQRFNDEKIKELNVNNLGYSNLHTGFFSKDLKLVKNQIASGCVEKNTYGRNCILPFITHLLEKNKNNGMTNILSDTSETKIFYKNNLHIENAPLGKWPSKYSPSFMQQLAINMAIKEGKENPNCFSVNGPPGTGKTTLLKEIIANSIVKKALCISTYEDADKAFKKQSFQHGDKLGHGYLDRFNAFYTVDESIARYGILVASSNNNAVENITLELPNGDNLINGIEVNHIDTKNENALQEIAGLFKQSQDNDIYFTKSANHHFNKLNKKDGDTKDDYFWGFISAALGKRSNINALSETLNSLFFECLSKNSWITEHKEKYKEAVKQLKLQEKRVKDIQNKIEISCDFEDNCKSTIENLLLSQKNNKVLYQKCEWMIENFESKSKEVEKQVKEHNKAMNEMRRELLKLKNLKGEEENLCKVQEQDIQTLESEIQQLETSRNIIDILCKIFRIKTMKESKIQEKYKLLEDNMQQLTVLKMDYHKAEEEYLVVLKKEKDLDNTLSKTEKKIKNYQLSITSNKRKKESILKTLDEIECSIKDTESKYEAWVQSIHKTKDYESFDALHEEFWKGFFGDNEKAAKAHLSNPWMSEEFNREREKLFYLSLQVIKEFIMSSKAIRCNLKNLIVMWKGFEGDEIVKYHEDDRVRAFPSLIHTLSILFPVISTTFASTGKFLEDIRDAFSLGTLIIDEAGQAQPYMALGAMLRCRKAIIVGDPKQVEPVVSDDLDAIKRILRKEEIIPYMNKKLSVQEFADALNKYGTYYENSENSLTWVGCPLVVHRRCISPMFEISNTLSYNNLMKQQTLPPKKEEAEEFSFLCSRWKNISGKEDRSNGKNHYIKEQGEFVADILIKAFEKAKDKIPSLYVISPFTSVSSGFCNDLKKTDFYKHAHKQMRKNIDEWMKKYCGTVHTFQGKEADEVVFLLGCDLDAKGAIRWVNTNIINVAVTRAKYRLCIVGDYQAWKHNVHMRTTKGIMDAYTLKQLNLANQNDQVDKYLVEELLDSLPKVEDLVEITNDGEEEIHLNDFMDGLNMMEDSFESLSKEEYQNYFLNERVVESLTVNCKELLFSGIKYDKLIKTMHEKMNIEMKERSCVNIMFCKAIELHLLDCFYKFMKECTMHYKDASFQKIRMGDIYNALHNNKIRLSRLSHNQLYSELWWQEYIDDLGQMKVLRNHCCHVSSFTQKDENDFRVLLFEKEMFSRSFAGKMIRYENI
ncbi:AAA domain-containing protein [Amedibacillus sp. YH-ame10]